MSESTSPTTTAAPRSPLTAVLLIVIAVLVMTIGVLAVDRQRLLNKIEASQGAAVSAEGESAAQATAEAEAAPSATKEDQLEIIRAQARRDPADGQARGDVDADVVLVLYSDFACPYCTLFVKEVIPGLEDLIADGTLRIEWRDLAQITEGSPLAAQAGRAAAAQGYFWQFHDTVYAAAEDGAHPEYTQDNLLEFARAAGIPDLEAFEAAMNSDEVKAAVEEAKQYAYSIGIQGTPFVFIGDTFISGYRDLDTIRATVLEQAKAAQ